MVGEIVVFGMLQPFFKMPEGILIRDKLNPPRIAVIIERTNFFRRHRARLAPNRFVSLVSERMLGVEF